MSVTAFFEKFIGLHQQRAQEKVDTYRELVAGIATGDEPNPVEVERLLADAGKSLDDLRLDVEYQRRMALRATVAEMPALEAERRSIDDEIAAADQILEAAEQQHEQTTEPLYARRREINQALAEGSTAQGELVRTCGDPDVIRDMADLEAEARRGVDFLCRRIGTRRTRKSRRGSRMTRETWLIASASQWFGQV